MTDKPTDKKVHVAESGRAAAVRVGTSDDDVAAALTGADELPAKGMELGRPPGKPEFDPHATVDVEEPLHGKYAICTLLLVTWAEEPEQIEAALREIIAYAEAKGLLNLSTSMGDLDPDLYEAITNG